MCSGFSGGSELCVTADFYDHIHSDQRWVMILPMLYTDYGAGEMNMKAQYKEVLAACT